MKKCSRCKEFKVIEAFHKDKSRKDGLSSTCKGCDAEYSRKYKQENPEKIAEYSRKYRQENPEKTAEYSRKYQQELRPSYLNHLIRNQTGLHAANVPPEFSDIKKAQVLIHRFSLTTKN